MSQQKGQAIELVDEFLNICYYNNGRSYGDWEAIRNILSSNNNQETNNLLVYLAIPPNIFGESCQAMKLALADSNVKVSGFKRIILEKPFGNDTQSCYDLLNVLKEQQWDEESLYRIDHYLGKEIVQAIPVFRRYNNWLTPLWNKHVIQSVHLVFKEPFGTDGRGGYFDPYGIIRDILQNHLLQVLTLIAMELPTSEDKWTSDNIRNAKVDILNNIAPIQLKDCLLGQYDGYKLDPSIQNKETTTPTYACLKAYINTPTWSGVPFIMEAGKAVNERICEARLYFRGMKGSNNALVFRLQPTPAVFFTANMKTPGYTDHPVSTHVGVDYGHCTNVPEAYTKLVLDVLRGKQENFVRDDELIAAWKIFTPLLHQIENDPINIKPYIYEEGSEGPTQRESFLNDMGVGSHLPIPSSL